ncbi:MAG: hypothetical protein ABL921_15130 [Pirellula sp.]
MNFRSKATMLAWLLCVEVGAVFFAGIQVRALQGQTVVQLPVVGNFSINTAVSVPDSGAAYLGSNRYGATSRQSRGGLTTGSASGSQMRTGGATAHATIIDLDELDRMIRSQTHRKPTEPQFAADASPPSGYPSLTKPKPTQKPEYAYLEALTHGAGSSQDRIAEDASYYLSLARNARQLGHWHAVELYYKLAWECLPPSRRERAIEHLENARSKTSETTADKSQSSKRK